MAVLEKGYGFSFELEALAPAAVAIALVLHVLGAHLQRLDSIMSRQVAVRAQGENFTRQAFSIYWTKLLQDGTW